MRSFLNRIIIKLDDMEKYEKAIGFKTIKLTFLRQWFAIVCIFIPIAIASLIATNLFVAKTYTSSSTLTREGSVIPANQFDPLVNKIKSTSNQVASNLLKDGIVHSNGKEITNNDILSGLSFSEYVSNSASITITYKSTDKSIVQPVVKEIVNYCVNSKSTVTEFAGLYVSSEASFPTTNSSQSKYLLIALAADAVASLAVPFLFEVIGDEVYDREDVELLGCPGFELNAQKKNKKDENEKDQYGNLQL